MRGEQSKHKRCRESCRPAGNGAFCEDCEAAFFSESASSQLDLNLSSSLCPSYQVVQLLVLPPAGALVRTYGQVSSDPQHGWLPADRPDPWGRGPAFMGYDNEKRAAIMSEARVFMAGLSDEAGFAQPLAMAIKQLSLPVPAEIEKLEAYVHETLLQAEGQTDGKYLQVGSGMLGALACVEKTA